MPILTEQSGPVTHLQIHRPDKKNALNSTAYTALTQALQASNADESCKVLVISGVPGAFSSGNDIADFAGVAMASHSAGQGMAGLSPILDFLKALVQFDKPLIAAVDGLAIGIGTTMLMHCDLVLATPESIFKTPFVDLGLVPEAGSSLLAPRRFGHQRAFDLLVAGSTWSAEDAHRAGLINHLVPASELVARTQSVAEAIAAKPAEAVRLSRNLLLGDRAELLARIEEEGALFAKRLQSAEALQAFQSFLQK